MNTEIVETDVLCVGGGISGLMAAIRAAESGVKVIVAEKANTLRSGAGGLGNDHFTCYIPEIHGPTVEALFKENQGGQMRRSLEDVPRATVLFEKSFDLVKLWDSWGIPMKYKGKWEFAGHRLPGSKYGVQLKYSGLMQKHILTRETLKRGAKIFNRTMIFDLLSDENGIKGALGLDTREGKLTLFKAKTAILCTGSLKRMYPGLIPGMLNNSNRPLTTSGDGRAMAYRVGAELSGMETLERHAGLKNFIRDGQGSWVGVYRDPKGRPIGPFLSRPERLYNDMIAEVNKDIFADYAREGKGPVYMDCRGISEEDLAYMEHWLRQEGNVAVLDHLKAEGIDLKKNPVEFTTYENNCWGGVHSNLKAETNIKGLYAAGDETAGGIARAAVFGWLAGENAAEFSRHSKITDNLPDPVPEKTDFLEKIMHQDSGPGWREVNIALQHTMLDYAGPARTASYLQAGLAHLKRINKKARSSIMALNSHELMRSLETLNLLEVAETIFVAALERKETRGLHVRIDYPYTNPMMDKPLVVRKVGKSPVAEWRNKGY